METEVRTDILNVLYKAVECLQREDYNCLRNLSDKTVHNSSIYQDTSSIGISVLIYALSKLLSKERIKQKHPDEYRRFLLNSTKKTVKMISFLESSDYTLFEGLLKSFLKDISNFDKKYSEYVQWVVTKAKITKAERIYEHGISLGQVSELLSIPIAEVMSYVGHTKFSERDEFRTLSPRERIKKTRKIFE